MHSVDVLVTRVIDGDTFVGSVETHIMDSEITLKNIYFRMEGINAPEVRGSTKLAGVQAREFLRELIEGKVVSIHAHKRDSFGRKLATVVLGSVNINQLMLIKGYAVPYEK